MPSDTGTHPRSNANHPSVVAREPFASGIIQLTAASRAWQHMPTLDYQDLMTPLLIVALLLSVSATPVIPVSGVEDVDILRLNSKMAKFLVRHVARRGDSSDRMLTLVETIFDPDILGISYDSQKTQSAIETFDAKSGNCLSFTFLYVAMARHLGLKAHFQEVTEVTSWDRRGEAILRNQHMFVEVELDNAHFEVDFLPGKEKRYRAVQRISDTRAFAHYYNNLGADLIAEGNAGLAIEYLAKSLELDARFAQAWTNLGIAYRRLGRLDEAESCHLLAIEIGTPGKTGETNLASLYLGQGRLEEAAPLLAEVEQHQNRNPFHHFQLALRSLRAGDEAQAIKSLKNAIRRRENEPEFHIVLAEIYRDSGDPKSARLSYERALPLVEDKQQRRELEAEIELLDQPAVNRGDSDSSTGH